MINAAPTSEMQSVGTLDVAPRLGNLLEEYSEISAIVSVLAGLLVTSRLQLRGAQALLVNLAIAAVARQVVIQLRKQAHQTPALPAAPNGQANGQASGISAPALSPPVEDYAIVHSTMGRIRLRIPRLITDASYARRLERLLNEEERVTGMRVNRAAASIAIARETRSLLKNPFHPFISKKF